MSKTKIGVFGILVFGVMMLLIPATSIANAAEYDKYYKEKDRYGKDYGYGYDNKKIDEPYKKVDKRYYDEYRQVDDRKPYEPYGKEYKKDYKRSDGPVTIIENKFPILHKEKKEEMKESPMVLVNKEVLFCDTVANGTVSGIGICEEDESGDLINVPGPNSGRYVEECTATEGIFGEVCDTVNSEFFNLQLVKEKEFKSSEEGTKLNIDENIYNIKESSNFNIAEVLQICRASGFDAGSATELDSENAVITCILFEGECSGTIQDGELKECTVKNYVVGAISTIPS